MTTSITSSTRRVSQLSYDNPLDAVFLRSLAWERHVAGRALPVGQVVTDQVRTARLDLGLPVLGDRGKSGAADDYIQRLRKKKLLSAYPNNWYTNGYDNTNDKTNTNANAEQ
jgi:hypothetical protein